MPLFDFDNYKDFIRDLVTGPKGYRGLRAELAKAMGCQAAYLTQVINAKADLTEEHGLRFSRHLRFSAIESQYFLLLVRKARASSPDLLNYLEEERKQLWHKAQDLKHRADSDTVAEDEKFVSWYFSSWLPSALHIATSSEFYKTPEALARRFNLSPDVVLNELHILEKYGLVKKKNARWHFLGKSIHLPKDSPLDSTHQLIRRVQAIHSIQQRRFPADLHFSSLFTLDKKSFEQLRQLMAGTIEEAQRKIYF